MASGPCPDCFTGTVSSQTPTGTTSTIHGFPTYIAAPEDGVKPKGVVVIITDAFGWDFVNNRVIADVYAKKGGLLVYIPDLMGGTAMSPAIIPIMDSLMKPASWFATIFYKPLYALQAISRFVPFMIRNRLSVVKPRVLAFFGALRSSAPPFPTNDLRIGVAGFCFGGRYAVLLAQDSPSSRVERYDTNNSSGSGALASLVDCSFTAHPSFLNVPKDIEAVQKPLSVSVGSDDMALKSSLVVVVKDILEKKGDDHECVILPGARHNFAIRTDPKDEEQMRFADIAEKQAISWFTKWFA